MQSLLPRASSSRSSVAGAPSQPSPRSGDAPAFFQMLQMFCSSSAPPLLAGLCAEDGSVVPAAHTWAPRADQGRPAGNATATSSCRRSSPAQRSAGKRCSARAEAHEPRSASASPPPALRAPRFPSVRPRCRSRLRSGRPLTSGARRAAARGLRRPPAAPVPPASAIPRPRRPAAVPRSGCAGWAPRARRSCAPAGGGAWRGCAARGLVGRCGTDAQICSPAAPWCAAAFPGAGGSGRDPRGASRGAAGCR